MFFAESIEKCAPARAVGGTFYWICSYMYESRDVYLEHFFFEWKCLTRKVTHADLCNNVSPNLHGSTF